MLDGRGGVLSGRDDLLCGGRDFLSGGGRGLLDDSRRLDGNGELDGRGGDFGGHWRAGITRSVWVWERGEPSAGRRAERAAGNESGHVLAE